VTGSFEVLSWFMMVRTEEKYGIYSHNSRLPG